MVILLMYVLALGAWFFGGAILVNATGAVHEIEGFIVILVGTVCFAGGVVAEEVRTTRKLFKETVKEWKTRTDLTELRPAEKDTTPRENVPAVA